MSAAAVLRSSWLHKSLAGTVLGFVLAVGVAGLFAVAAPAGPSKFQMVMWLVAPLWMGILCAVFLFRDAWRAWAWLGGAGAAVHALLFLVRHLAG